MYQPTRTQRQQVEIVIRRLLEDAELKRHDNSRHYIDGVILSFQILAVVQGFDSLAYIPTDIVDKFQVCPL